MLDKRLHVSEDLEIDAPSWKESKEHSVERPGGRRGVWLDLQSRAEDAGAEESPHNDERRQAADSKRPASDQQGNGRAG